MINNYFHNCLNYLSLTKTRNLFNSKFIFILAFYTLFGKANASNFIAVISLAPIAAISIILCFILIVFIIFLIILFFIYNNVQKKKIKLEKKKIADIIKTIRFFHLDDFRLKLLHSKTNKNDIEIELCKLFFQHRKILPYLPDHLMIHNIEAEGDEQSMDSRLSHSRGTKRKVQNEDTAVDKVEEFKKRNSDTTTVITYSDFSDDIDLESTDSRKLLNVQSLRRTSVTSQGVNFKLATPASYQTITNLENINSLPNVSMFDIRGSIYSKYKRNSNPHLGHINHPNIVQNHKLRMRSNSTVVKGSFNGHKSIGAFITRVLQNPGVHHNSPSSTREENDHTVIQTSIIENGLEIKDVSIAVVDIQGFHELCESLSSYEVARIHSDYLDFVTLIVRTYKGAVNHIIGDKVICSWNASNPVVNHALNAVSAAYYCKMHMARLNQQYEDEGLPHITISISVLTGSSLVGITGKHNIKHFSLFGSLINEVLLFSKLNSFYKTRILINEECFKQVRSNFLIRLVDIITVASETKLQDKCLFEVHSEKELKMEEWNYYYHKSILEEKRFFEYNMAWISFMKGLNEDANKYLDCYLDKNPIDAHAHRLRKRIEIDMKCHPLLNLKTRLHDFRLRFESSEMEKRLYNITPLNDEHHEHINIENILKGNDYDI